MHSRPETRRRLYIFWGGSWNLPHINEPWPVENRSRTYMCLGKKQASVAILAQAKQGGCPIGPCAMSAPNASTVSHESVLIAYRWPRTHPASDLPNDIVDLCPSETPLERVRRVTGYICRGPVALDDVEEPLASETRAVTFFRLTATARQTQRLAARAAEPTGSN